MALVAQSTTQTSTQTDNIALLSSRKNLQMEEIYQQTFSAKINYFEQGVPERTHLEDFICGVYKKYYNADIDQFYPNLLAIESRADNKRTIKAVAGIRSAEHEPLFSEYYLANNLEDEIRQHLGGKDNRAVSRKTIVEVGNLAPANVGQMRWLITSITGFLYSAGFKYLVFTGVPGISNSFTRMNIPLTVLAEAKRESLPEAIRDKWGPEYYQNKPMVFLGDIAQGYDIMKKMIYQLSRKQEQKLIPLFEQACQAGFQSVHHVNGKVA